MKKKDKRPLIISIMNQRMDIITDSTDTKHKILEYYRKLLLINVTT